MKLTDIPYFKTVIIMCTTCDVCGVKNSEVKPGTAIEEKGIKFILKLTDPSDLNRDLIKSEFATFEIPEVEFYMNSGTLGGKFTTIEGLLKDCREQLGDLCPFAAGGDSEVKDNKTKLSECLDKLGLIQNGQMLDVTIILDDPSGNSYLQVKIFCSTKKIFKNYFKLFLKNVYAPDDDPNMEIVRYERDYDQNDMLGLNDMKTENYTDDS
jgi:zinc finger protein